MNIECLTALAGLFAAIGAFISAGVAWHASKSTVATLKKITEENQRHNKRIIMLETYQRLHEALVRPEAAKGRRLLFIAFENKNYPKPGEHRWDEINYSLALYDTLGGYMLRDMVDQKMVLEVWHHPLQNIYEPVNSFMSWREQHNIYQPWTFLMKLLEDAKNYPCQCNNFIRTKEEQRD